MRELSRTSGNSATSLRMRLTSIRSVTCSSTPPLAGLAVGFYANLLTASYRCSPSPMSIPTTKAVSA